MNNYYTYAYLREDMTPYYIGKGKRSRAYKKGSRVFAPPPRNRILMLKLNLTEEEAFKHEKYMIAVFGRKDLGTGILHNRTGGGDGKSGAIVNDKTKQKISKASKGRKHTEETKNKLRDINLGKIVSEETRKKLREINLGKKYSEETKAKLKKSKSGKNHPLYGKKHSDKTKKLMSELQSGEKNNFYGRKQSQEWLGMILDISCKYEYTIISPFGDIFHTENMANFCREHNLHNGAMSLVSSGKRKHHKNWKVTKKMREMGN